METKTKKNDTINQDEAIKNAKQLIKTEADAIAQLHMSINAQFWQACQTIQACNGRVIVSGMGKSGHIAGKVAATLASTGTPAFFVHPGEAGHGDMGMLTNKDVMLIISYSGHTNELLTLLPSIKRLGIPLICITGRENSPLAQAATITLNINVGKEACPLGLAPTSSTTASLVMGDALAITLLKMRKFTSKDFAHAHPSGNLGKQLLLTVGDIMHTEAALPMSQPKDKLNKVLVEMTNKRMGFTTIVDPKSKKLLGVFTDGDLRRTLDAGTDIHSVAVGDIMTPNSIITHKDILVTDALNIMHDNRITVLVITNLENQPIGIIHMHDLIKTGVQKNDSTKND